jgi:hypothetical protein
MKLMEAMENPLPHYRQFIHRPRLLLRRRLRLNKRRSDKRPGKSHRFCNLALMPR